MRATWKGILAYCLLALLLMATLVPLYVIVRVAFADPTALMNRDEWRFTLQHVRDVVSSGNLWPPLHKSLVVACATALFSVLLAAPAAYVLARIPGRMGYAFIIAIFFTRMAPEVGVALPISLTFIRMGLFDTSAGLVLAHMVRVLPLVTWVLIGTFQSIPHDLEEAARMDGCSRVQALWKIILPAAKPGVIVALIFGFLNSWDEFIYATYLTQTHRTLPLMVYYYVERGGWFLSSTYALVVTVPALVFTHYFQRYLQSGYLAGAVKG